MTIPSIPEIYNFYRELYHGKIVDLSAEFPHVRSIEVSYTDIAEYSGELEMGLINNPSETLFRLEKALVSYPDKPPYGSLSFDEGETNRDEAPFVRITGLPNTIQFTKLHDNANHLVKLVGIVSQVEEPEAKVATGVYECALCGSEQSIEFRQAEETTPRNCPQCSNEDTLRFDLQKSRMVDSQSLRLNSRQGYDRDQVDVELRNELVGTVSVNDPIAVTGIVYCDKVRDSIPQCHILANSISDVSRARIKHPSLSSAETYLGQEKSGGDDFEDELSDFAERSKQILQQQVLTEEGGQAKIINPLLHLLGWDVYSPFVRWEYSESKVSGQVDYMLIDQSYNPVLPIEAKSPSTILSENVAQIQRYVEGFDTEFGLLSNGREFKLYQDTGEDFVLVFNVSLSEFPVSVPTLRALRRENITSNNSLYSVFDTNGY